MENMITVDKDELFDIMCDFTDVEHIMLNLIIVCNVLAEHYNGTEFNELYAFVSLLTNQVDMIQKEFRRVINRVDEFLLTHK
jgi:hypothetical protein